MKGLDSHAASVLRLSAMQVRIPIGQFSRMTYLSVRALRLYHELGLLEPALVDRGTGYRYYEPAQVPTAQVIRRLRDLGMPIDGIRHVVTAPDVSARNEAILAHLARMQRQLAATQATVASLQALLDRPVEAPPVAYRSLPPAPALAITEQVRMEAIGDWWSAAFDELHGVLERQRVPAAGVYGALYAREFFEDEVGSIVAFVPVDGEVAAAGRAAPFTVPGAELVVALHEGSFNELDRTYAALGTYVAEREIGVDGPIREHYLAVGADDGRIEVCWPVFHTRGENR